MLPATNALKLCVALGHQIVHDLLLRGNFTPLGVPKRHRRSKRTAGNIPLAHQPGHLLPLRKGARQIPLKCSHFIFNHCSARRQDPDLLNKRSLSTLKERDSRFLIPDLFFCVINGILRRNEICSRLPEVGLVLPAKFLKRGRSGLLLRGNLATNRDSCFPKAPHIRTSHVLEFLHYAITIESNQPVEITDAGNTHNEIIEAGNIHNEIAGSNSSIPCIIKSNKPRSAIEDDPV